MRCRGCLSCLKENLVANDAETKYYQVKNQEQCSRNKRKIGMSDLKNCRTQNTPEKRVFFLLCWIELRQLKEKKILKSFFFFSFFSCLLLSSSSSSATRFDFTKYKHNIKNEKLNKLLAEIWWWRKPSLNENWIYITSLMTTGKKNFSSFLYRIVGWLHFLVGCMFLLHKCGVEWRMENEGKIKFST